MGRIYLAALGLATLLVAQGARAAGQVAAAAAGIQDGNRASNTAVTARKQPGQVTQAVFTTGIKHHEPVNNISVLTNKHRHVYFFTDLRHMTGQTVTHRWTYKGKVVAQVKFKVGGPRWRVYSRKTLNPAWLGEWQASVVDANGITLGVSTFEYSPAPAASTTPHQGSVAPAAPASHP
ncbi:MAG: DUF2914 domain-containing protein [Gammaproteobacteria bacterium]|nr:DUF2914 domain-containing protein [Gammaproteobacteria bacterium]